MNEIQELKDRREQTILEKETLERELIPYAAALEDYEELQSLEENLRYRITDKKERSATVSGTSRRSIRRSIAEKHWPIIRT